MAIWDAWFRQKPYASAALRSGLFGRYTDTYKSDFQLRSWKQAVEAFEKGQNLAALEFLLGYLNDPIGQSVSWHHQNSTLHFEVVQGSQKLIGRADAFHIRVEAPLVHLLDNDLRLFRQLLEANFKFEYCRYAISELNQLVLTADLYLADAAPHKLYQAFRELALHADKQDDLLLSNFDTVESVTENLRAYYNEDICRVQYEYLHRQVAKLVDHIQSCGLDPEQHQGALAYMMLACMYRLDYLLKPEGANMDMVEQMRRHYFDEQAGGAPVLRNRALLQRLIAWTEQPFEVFCKSQYKVKHTFGLTTSENHDRFVGFVEGELHHMDWYLGRGYVPVALAVPEYIIGHCLFNFALPQPLRDLLHMYYEIAEADYFRLLGFEVVEFTDKQNRLQESKIRTAIAAIVEKYLPAYPHLNTRQLALDCSGGLALFAKSYLRALTLINFNR
jgi:hypothetical protein